jgi:dinuclear metal center YbgI/SA1388 family protein
MANLSQTLDYINEKSPTKTAESWDNSGLLVKTETCVQLNSLQTVNSAVISIDLTRVAVDTAVATGSPLIIVHHPIVFPSRSTPGWNRLDPGPNTDSLLALALECYKRDIAVLCCHSDFDQNALEVGTKIATLLGCTIKGRLLDRAQKLLKLVAFIPETHLEKVRDSICAAGAGHIGKYDFCTYGTKGQGTFRGLEESRPFLGQPQTLEQVNEIRLETIIPESLKDRVVQALLKAHPYEEVAFDLYPLLNSMPSGAPQVAGFGYGFYGDYSENLSFSELTLRVTSCFDVSGFWLNQPEPDLIKRIAFTPGKGNSFVGAAEKLKCDVLITGEVGYHGVLDAARNGLSIIELGHRESEHFFPLVIQEWLEQISVRGIILDTPRKLLKRREK